MFTSEGDITQDDFAGIVNSGLYKGDVNILSGVHGLESGEMIAEQRFYEADLAAFGRIPGVTVYNVANMSREKISSVLGGPGTTIGGFCNSGPCLAPFG